jgi:NAD(P)H-dependent FMN reductase
MALVLHVVICSTRPGRTGPSVAEWFQEAAVRHGGFASQKVDLAAFRLPVFDEPHHPRLRRYEKAHTIAWSESVASADAFVFVTPEYNFGPPPSFVNAINYLYVEWNYKPAGFVSYGGLSGGTRAAQLARPLLTAVKVMPIPEGVAVPMIPQFLDDRGRFKPSEAHEGAAVAMLDELGRWAQALKPLRG